jgi:hypothetical protein
MPTPPSITRNGVCVNSNWSYIAFHLRCRTGHQCRSHFNNLIIDGRVAQEKYTLCCQGASNAFVGEEDWASQLTEKWKEGILHSLQSSIEKVLIDTTASRAPKKKDVHEPESPVQLALGKDYASKTLKLQVQALRFVPEPRMPPIQIIPPNFPKYFMASERGTAARQDKNRRVASDNIQIFQPGTASKSAHHNTNKAMGDVGKSQAQRRPIPGTLREASEVGSENSLDLDDQDFSRSLSTLSTVSAGNRSQSGIVLGLRDFMGCHTMDIINMALRQGIPSDDEDAVSINLLSDAKTLLLGELKYVKSFFDAFASADEEARSVYLKEQGQYLVGSCNKVYEASRSIVIDDAPLVREDVLSLALNLCDVLQLFSSDPVFCFALNFLLKALMKLHAVTPQLLDNVLICCICLAQNTPVLLEECSSPKDLLFTKSYIKVRCPLLLDYYVSSDASFLYLMFAQLFFTTASAFTNQKPGMWENLTRLFCALSDRMSTVSFEWFWEVVCVGVGCMHNLHLQNEGSNPKMLTVLFSKLVEVTCKEFSIILLTYSVHRANNFAITMMERMMFLLEFCSFDTKACASVIAFSSTVCFQCKADTHIFVDDCCRDLSASMPWECLRGQLLQRPCAAFSILFEKLAIIPSVAQKTARTRANQFLSIILEAMKSLKPKSNAALQANIFSATRECRHVLRLICKKKTFILKQDSVVMHSGCTNCCLDILEFLDTSKMPVAILTDAMTAMQLFIEPLIQSLPPDTRFQEHDVVKKLLEILPNFRGNSEGHIGDSRFGVEFRTKVGCFVVLILKDFCVADACFTEGISVVTQLLDFVHMNIRNLFSETNRLNNSNSDQTHTLVTIPQLESALSDLCDVISSLCIHADDANHVIANKIHVSRAIIVTFFKCMFEDGLRLPCSLIKSCVATFHRLVTGYCIVLDKLQEFNSKIQSLQDEHYSVSCELTECEHAANPFSDSNDDDNMALISSLMERRNILEKEIEKEQRGRPAIVHLAESLRRACAQLPDSLIWHLHGLIINRYADSTQDKRDARFKVSEDLSQICLRSFTLEWRIRAHMDDFFKTSHSPWHIWFKFFGPESASITIVSGMRVKEGQYTTAATAQRLIPLHAALYMADAASEVVTAHPEQFLRIWILFALDVKCPKQEVHSLFNSICRVLFPHIQSPLLLATPFPDALDNCAIVCCQILHLSQVLSSSAKSITASFCGFFESALQFGLGCLLLVPQYIRDQQSDLTRYFCRIAALLCKSFWQELIAIPSNQSKQASSLNWILTELFILPPKFLHDSSGAREILEDLVACCLAWAQVDCSAAMHTLYQIIRAQLQFIVSESGLPSRPQSAVDQIVHVLYNAASTQHSSHLLVVQTLQCLARSAALQMTLDIRCLCFHVIAGCINKLLAANVKSDCDTLLDAESAEAVAFACCQTFVELMQELSNSSNSNFAEALAELRTCVCQLCNLNWPSTQPPAWLILIVRFIGCTLLMELIVIMVPRESNSPKYVSAQFLARRLETCQSACSLQIAQDFRASINKPKTLPMSQQSVIFLMFLASLCDGAPHAFSCDMQLAASLIASHFVIPAVDASACVVGHMLLDVCGRQGFASSHLM